MVLRGLKQTAKLFGANELDPKIRIPFREITLHKVIGKGTFKTVYRGSWNSTAVAVVAMRRGGLVAEARLLQRLSTHPNLVQLYRWSADEAGNEYLVTELLQLGSLDAVLRSIGRQLLTQTKMTIVEQVVSACLELSHEGLVHGDLAARNLLVKSLEPPHVKLADFGLARPAAPEGGPNAANAGSGSSVSLLRMCQEHANANRQCRDLVPTDPIDPIDPIDPTEPKQILSALLAGFRLERPRGCPLELWDLVLHCWSADPRARPSFAGIAATLRGWREAYVSSKVAAVTAANAGGSGTASAAAASPVAAQGGVSASPFVGFAGTAGEEPFAARSARTAGPSSLGAVGAAAAAGGALDAGGRAGMGLLFAGGAYVQGGAVDARGGGRREVLSLAALRALPAAAPTDTAALATAAAAAAPALPTTDGATMHLQSQQPTAGPGSLTSTRTPSTILHASFFNESIGQPSNSYPSNPSHDGTDAGNSGSRRGGAAGAGPSRPSRHSGPAASGSSGTDTLSPPLQLDGAPADRAPYVPRQAQEGAAARAQARGTSPYIRISELTAPWPSPGVAFPTRPAEAPSALAGQAAATASQLAGPAGPSGAQIPSPFDGGGSGTATAALPSVTSVVAVDDLSLRVMLKMPARSSAPHSTAALSHSLAMPAAAEAAGTGDSSFSTGSRPSLMGYPAGMVVLPSATSGLNSDSGVAPSREISRDMSSTSGAVARMPAASVQAERATAALAAAAAAIPLMPQPLPPPAPPSGPQVSPLGRAPPAVAHGSPVPAAAAAAAGEMTTAGGQGGAAREQGAGPSAGDGAGTSAPQTGLPPPPAVAAASQVDLLPASLLDDSSNLLPVLPEPGAGGVGSSSGGLPASAAAKAARRRTGGGLTASGAVGSGGGGGSGGTERSSFRRHHSQETLLPQQLLMRQAQQLMSPPATHAPQPPPQSLSQQRLSAALGTPRMRRGSNGSRASGSQRCGGDRSSAQGSPAGSVASSRGGGTGPNTGVPSRLMLTSQSLPPGSPHSAMDGRGSNGLSPAESVRSTGTAAQSIHSTWSVHSGAGLAPSGAGGSGSRSRATAATDTWVGAGPGRANASTMTPASWVRGGQLIGPLQSGGGAVSTGAAIAAAAGAGAAAQMSSGSSPNTDGAGEAAPTRNSLSHGLVSLPDSNIEAPPRSTFDGVPSSRNIMDTDSVHLAHAMSSGAATAEGNFARLSYGRAAAGVGAGPGFRTVPAVGPAALHVGTSAPPLNFLDEGQHPRYMEVLRELPESDSNALEHTDSVPTGMVAMGVSNVSVANPLVPPRALLLSRGIEEYAAVAAALQTPACSSEANGAELASVTRGSGTAGHQLLIDPVWNMAGVGSAAVRGSSSMTRTEGGSGATRPHNSGPVWALGAEAGAPGGPPSVIFESTQDEVVAERQAIYDYLQTRQLRDLQEGLDW
ncbi:hypothetical protein GPECTOR_5g122 [Gonium pectorale]|uniref:Protein kinase domain-containing protein n=1 Tax=Gonium pectorale TaxID=33097 RepID=A0A150GVZ5_GONPE|nr:hypothetical protein GPECTOR_5g122 [Gonium pectorale]|eukprot:KXZ54011.1 hypothetical protein GPECTOR_5g122 [Gonium pectorale]